jgi:hypothetical protein
MCQRHPYCQSSTYTVYLTTQSPNFKTFKERKSRLQGTNSARLCSLSSSVQTFKESRNRFQGITSACPWGSLAGRDRFYNPIPTWTLAPIDCLKIPALAGRYDNPIPTRFLTPAQYKVQILCGFMRAQISFELWHEVGQWPYTISCLF